jgi:STE24 endopeptidase
VRDCLRAQGLNFPPMESTVLLWSFVVALVLSTLLKLWLVSRQIRHVATHRDQVPAAFAGSVSLQAHQRAADYTTVKARFGLLVTAFGVAVLVGWTLLGGLDALNTWVFDQVQPRWGSMAYQLGLLVAFVLVGSLLDLPFELYSTFRIEQQFGFNRMTWKLYLADTLKGVVVGAAIGLPLAWLMLWIMGTTGPQWWLWAWGTWVGFNLLLMVAYPTVIAPLFNKFEPLADEGVKTRVQALMQRCGFASKGLFVMDGSKRSAHGNAYFTGLGAAKRVVFFDTLLNKLTPGEVEAVLAHELGHFKHQHVKQRMVMMFAVSLAGFALLGWLSNQTWFYTALGVTPHLGAAPDALALLLFMLVVPVYISFVSPLMAQLSRKHEFQADAYACAQSSGSDLAQALLKLHEDNASTLTPDPVYVRFYYSHPPASERLAALQRQPAAAATGA